MKKKIILGIILVFIISLVIWKQLPYITTVNNIISNEDTDYSYDKVTIYNMENYEEEPFQNTDEEKIEEIISKIDNLKLIEIKEYGGMDYSIGFHGTYTLEERVTYTGCMFRIILGETEEGYTLTFDARESSRIKNYKILNEDFEMDKFIEELTGGNV